MILARLVGNAEAVTAQHAALCEIGDTTELSTDVWTALRVADPRRCDRRAFLGAGRPVRRIVVVRRIDWRMRVKVMRTAVSRDPVARVILPHANGTLPDGVADLLRPAPANTRIFERLPASLWPSLAPSAVVDRLSRGVRSAFDPHRLLNPGILGRTPSVSTTLPGRRSLPCAIPDTPLAAAIPGIETCVHCGFCLQACPTYVNLEDENDSPRGRIVLMRAVVEGELAARRPERADPHRSMPRMSSMRDGVPVGRALRAVARSHARHAANRSPDTAARAHHPRRLRERRRASRYAAWRRESSARPACRRCSRAAGGRLGFRVRHARLDTIAAPRSATTTSACPGRAARLRCSTAA